MMRCALTSCVLLGLTLAACGKPPPPKIPQVSIPGPTAWDGTPPAPGTVTLVSPLPGDETKFVAYEVDPAKAIINRTIVDDIDKIAKMTSAVIANSMDNAGTINVIYRPPPPPPDGQELVRRARAMMEASRPEPGKRQDPRPVRPMIDQQDPTHQ